MLIYGIDVSKEHLDIFCLHQDVIIYQKRIKNKFSAINLFLKSIKPQAVLCAEYTGIYSNLLVHLACCMNIKIALASGYEIKHSMGNPRGKSDLIDAQRIWEYANRFFDKLLFRELEEPNFTEIKSLFNFRNQLTKALKSLTIAKTSSKNQVACSVAECKFREETETQLKLQIKKVEKELITLIKSNQKLSKNFELVTSITGIGPITAIELIISTGNFKRIDSPRKAAAYAGICPYPNQSGNIKKKQRIHFRSNKKLKSLLHMCAKTICNHNKEFKFYRERKMMEGKHFYLVMNNVSNKIIRTVYAVIQSGKPFDINHITIDPRCKTKIT